RRRETWSKRSLTPKNGRIACRDASHSIWQAVGMAAKLSIASEDSFLSIASTRSFLSIGSVGSFASIGSIGSALSAFSASSWLSIGSVMSERSCGGVMDSQRQAPNRARTQGVAVGVLAAMLMYYVSRDRIR